MSTPTCQSAAARPNHHKNFSLEKAPVNKSNAIKMSTTSSRIGAGESVAETGRADKQPSSKITASSIPTTAFAKRDQIATQRKSLLPSRSNLVRGRRGVPERLSVQNEVSQLQQPGSLQQRQSPPDCAPAARCPSLAQPGDHGALPSAKVLPSGPRISRAIRRPASPKRQALDSKVTVPGSPLKSQMPTPPRPTRSASLCQPATPKIAIPAESRGHARHRSQVLEAGAVTAGYTARPTDRSSSTTTARPKRPQFSTYQQHFSPKKGSKSLVSITVPPRPAESEAGSIPASRPDVAALQIELLQLCLLHSSYSQRDAAWRLGSGKDLQKQYDSVAENYRVLLAGEREAQFLLNIHALHHWFANAENNPSRSNFAAQIQTFSRTIQEVADLTGPGGRYTQVVKTFEDWIQSVNRIKDRRKKSVTSLDISTEEQEFICPLNHGWKEEIQLLSTKVELCLRELQTLDYPTLEDEDGEYSGDRTLRRITIDHKDLLSLMTDELRMMRRTEVDIIRLERSWTARTADQSRAIDESTVHVPRTGAWKRAWDK